MHKFKFLTLLTIFIFGSFTAHLLSQEDVFKIAPNMIQWTSNPALPKEIKTAVLLGDPNKEGPLVLRLKAPAGSKIPPHWHQINENVTVLSGSLNFGSGSQFDTNRGVRMIAGSFVLIPAKHSHYVWFTEDTVLQLSNFGKWDIRYIDPKDDPRIR